MQAACGPVGPEPGPQTGRRTAPDEAVGRRRHPATAAAAQAAAARRQASNCSQAWTASAAYIADGPPPM
jgi:hypothetical protein